MKARAWMELGRGLDLRPGTFEEHGFASDPRVDLAEALLWVRNKEGLMVPLAANATQREFERRAGRMNIVLKARQMGVTTWIAGRFLLKTMLIPGTASVLVAHTRESAEAIFCGVRRMWECLPDDVREEMGLGRVRCNVSELRLDGSASEFRVMSAADSNAGRGATISNLHCSEVARWPGDASETLAGLKAALVPGGEMVMESTPNGAWGVFYREWCEAEANGVVRHFFPWWMEESYVAEAVSEATLTDAERAVMRRAGLTLEQIGFRRRLERTYHGLRAQEFAEDAVSCFRASGDVVFDVSAVRVSEAVQTRWNGALHVWLPAAAGRTYVLGVDPAGGGAAGDYAAVQVVDKATGMQCAELRERLHPRMLAERVSALAAEYNGALVVVERNNHGAAVLAYLEGRGLRVFEERGQAGLLTTSVSRAEMIAALGARLHDEPRLFRSARLMKECGSFVLTRNGRAEAASGAHDDLVMAMALALWVLDRRSKSAGQRVSKSAVVSWG